jgi:hypothetical protein
MIFLDHVTLLMQAKIILAFLAVTLLCGLGFWSVEISKNSICKMTLQRLRLLSQPPLP